MEKDAEKKIRAGIILYHIDLTSLICGEFYTIINVNDQNCIKNLLPDNNATLVDVLPTLSAGECLVVGDAVPLPAVVKMDMPNPVPNSSNVNVYDEWNKDWIDIAFEDVISRWRKE